MGGPTWTSLQAYVYLRLLFSLTGQNMLMTLLPKVAGLVKRLHRTNLEANQWYRQQVTCSLSQEGTLPHLYAFICSLLVNILMPFLVSTSEYTRKRLPTMNNACREYHYIRLGHTQYIISCIQYMSLAVDAMHSCLIQITRTGDHCIGIVLCIVVIVTLAINA